jgi:hypothetical protein
MKYMGHIGYMGEMSNECKILVERPQEKVPHGRCRHTWEDNIKIDPDEK